MTEDSNSSHGSEEEDSSRSEESSNGSEYENSAVHPESSVSLSNYTESDESETIESESDDHESESEGESGSGCGSESYQSDDASDRRRGAILHLMTLVQQAAESNNTPTFDQKYRHLLSEKLTGTTLEDSIQTFMRSASTTSTESTSSMHSLTGYVQLRKTLVDQLADHPENPIIPDMIRQTESKITTFLEETRTSNARAYFDLLSADNTRGQGDDVDYFFRNCSAAEQATYLDRLALINAHVAVNKPYRLQVLGSNLSVQNQAVILDKLRTLASLTPQDSEYAKVHHWIDGIMRVPFGVYKSLAVQMGVSSPEECLSFLENARARLDACTYGMKDAKDQIMQMLGSWVANPTAGGRAIAIEGPMGTGKTTLIKDGVSKILGREFAFVALGGATGGAYLDGFSYTYEGSTWGKIVQILMDVKSMNPVIYFDELDKISGTPQGAEIENILVHLTDSSQNSEFSDKYFSELSFPLDKCMFIFSYNDRTKVNPILLDRMYNIHTKGYNAKDKVVIARQYLVPVFAEQLKFTPEDVVLTDDILAEIVEKYTGTEQGVRNLKRCLETVYSKLNLLRLGCAVDGVVVPTFPLTLDSATLRSLMGGESRAAPSWLAMYN